MMSLFFLFQISDVSSHPFLFTGVGDTQCSSTLCVKPEKADEKQRSEIRLQTKEHSPLSLTLVFCKLGYSKKKKKKIDQLLWPFNKGSEERTFFWLININILHLRSSADVAAIPSILNGVSFNKLEREKLWSGLLTAVHHDLSCRKMERQIQNGE